MITYRATNTTNGSFYIGSTTNFEKRRKAHLCSKENYPFQNALRLTPEVFEWEVWEDDYEEPLLEQALLDMWYGKGCCYNLNPGADRPPVNHGGGKRARERSLGFLSEESVKRRSREIKVTCVETGESLIFESLQEASRVLNLSPGNLSEVTHGRRKQTKGYTAVYLTNQDDKHI